MKLAVIVISSMALAGCSIDTREYEMSVDAASVKLVNADFARGILPGSSGLKPKVQRNYEGTLEWHVLDDSENGNGWWCPLKIEPVVGETKKVSVVNECKGIMAMENKKLDELVDATLTGRPPKFS